ncbi:Murein DD-endopeptidase MepM and murein hydrolase activator NlpD, contain LysM domain [Tindallia magadiensis]|uniref:Murein DD-endopeptidase MepM and murein hydrolase activator NlpD, contain LysM domain n=1 Tax=Tindallia magadiensis TaxID=69895 RepID=A0A1I3HT97_9FIRM|nr:M23 family metallopeptidase [Tindallia magadiensis]SFI38945.1 Murein DD-endopeptidase MepM and murein hydrolase activator NlpD, contain LysM domain [Tindallia magadiensis]
MKQNFAVRYPWITLAFIMMITMMILLVLFIFPVPASLVSGITVVHQESGTSRYHSLDYDDATALLQGLSGDSSPETWEEEWSDSMASFTMTLHSRWFPNRQYEITASMDEILVTRRTSRQPSLSRHPVFFYLHPAFEALYAHATPPTIQLQGADNVFHPPVIQNEWEFQRFDGSWTKASQVRDFSHDDVLPVDRSHDRLRLNLDPYPDQVWLQVTDPSGAIRYNEVLESSTLPIFPYNGRHDYQLEFSWTDDEQSYRGSITSAFSLEMNLPPEFQVPGPHALQGEMLVFHARHLPDGASPVFLHSLTEQVHFYPLEDGVVAYIPTHYGTSPGEYVLSYGLEGEPLQETTITLHPRDFHIQYLTIDTGVAATTRNEEAAAMTAKYFTPSRNHSNPERYYTEPFIIPVKGRLTTEFGETRYVNNAPTSYRHSGLDIAAPTGTPVAATNRGKVVLAMDLITQGKTVVIDHGQGLFSVYFHLDELKTVENKVVERGEIIGTVGTTGFSTGPHLHFTMSHYRHNLEPGHFLVGEPITYQNAVHYLAPQE